MPAPKKGPRLGGGPAHERLILSTLYYLPQKLTDEMVETIELQKKEALTARIQFEERGEKSEGKRKHDDCSEEEDDPIQDDSEQYATNKKEEE